MSATFRSYANIIADDPSGVFTIPSAIQFPSRTHEATITGDYKALRRVTIEPETGKMLWTYSENQDFEVLALLADEDPGYLYCWYKGDTPTSESDLAPSGLHPRWRQFDLSCLTWFYLNTDQCRIDTLSAAQDVGETAGIPSAAGSATLALGKVYGLYAYNPSTEDAASLWLGVLN